jgi:hypothetical protein
MSVMLMDGYAEGQQTGKHSGRASTYTMFQLLKILHSRL